MPPVRSRIVTDRRSGRKLSSVLLALSIFPPPCYDADFHACPAGQANRAWRLICRGRDDKRGQQHALPCFFGLQGLRIEVPPWLTLKPATPYFHRRHQRRHRRAGRFEYPVKVEDAGPGDQEGLHRDPARPDRRRSSKKQFKELRQQAAIPGFRAGHAPQKLIEKRFATDVKDRSAARSSARATSRRSRRTSSRSSASREFDNPDSDPAPREPAPLSYTFQVEVQPEFRSAGPQGRSRSRSRRSTSRTRTSTRR